MFIKLMAKKQKSFKYALLCVAFLLVFTKIFTINVFAGSLSKNDVETINLGTVQYFGVIAEESVTNNSHCPSNVLTNNLTTVTVGYDRSGKDMFGDEYSSQGIGVIYVTGNFDFLGGQVYASKLFLNSNYTSFVEYNQRYLVNNSANDSANVNIGTDSQCRDFYNIGSDDDKTGINLPVIFDVLKSLSNDLALKIDKGVTTNGNNILVTNNSENIMTIDENWSYKTMFISDQNFKSTNSTLLVNVKLAEDTKEFYLSQVKAGYSAYDSTDDLVINFGEFNGTVYLNETSGTILAPNADIVVASGDHHGRVIGQNIIVNSEIHFIPSFDIPVEEEPTTPSEEETTTPEEESTTPEEETTTPEEETTTPEEESTTPEEETTTPEEETTTPEEETTTPEEETTTPEEETTTPEEETTTPEEEPTTPEEEEPTTPEEEEPTTPEEEEPTTPVEEDPTVPIEDPSIPLDGPNDDNEFIIILDDKIALDGGMPTTSDNNNFVIYIVAALIGLAIVSVTSLTKVTFSRNLL